MVDQKHQNLRFKTKEDQQWPKIQIQRKKKTKKVRNLRTLVSSPIKKKQ